MKPIKWLKGDAPGLLLIQEIDPATNPTPQVLAEIDPATNELQTAVDLVRGYNAIIPEGILMQAIAELIWADDVGHDTNSASKAIRTYLVGVLGMADPLGMME